MEPVVDLIELADLKLQSIRNSYDEAHSQASSILSLTLHLNDFQDQFDLVKDSLLKQAQELDLRAEKIAETAQLLEKRDQEGELKLKEINEKLNNLQSEDYHLVLLQKWIQERSVQLTLAEKQLISTRKELEDCNETLSMKRGELALVQMRLNECSCEHDAKREQFGTIEKSMEECSRNLKLDETKLDLVTVKLEECCKDLYVRNVDLSLVEKSAEVCSKELEMKEQEVERARIMSTNCDEELKVKQKELSMIKNRISDCDGELELKRKQLRRLQKWSDKYSSDIDLKMRSLGGTEKSLDRRNQNNIREDRKELDLKEKELAKLHKLIEETSNALNSKEIHLESIKVLIEDYAEALEAKERQYDVICTSINKCAAELSMKQLELDSIDNSIREKSSKLTLKRKKLDLLIELIKSTETKFSSLKETMETNCEDLELKFSAVQESIRERNEELASKENLLKSVQMSVIESSEELESMKKQQNILKISVAECSKELESKEKSLDLLERSLKEWGDELTSKEAELESMKRTTCGFQKELEERGEYLDSLKTTLEQQSEKLQIKEREFEARAVDLELRGDRIDLLEKSILERFKQLECKEKQLNDNFQGLAMAVHRENLTANCCITDGRSLQLILNQNLREYDSILDEVFTVLQKSPDPGKLVLDAIQGFYPTDVKNGDTEFSMSVVRRSCTTLIGQLLKISPQVKPEVRETAMKLALDWKSRMKALPENSLEVLAYLQLLAAFKLASSFSRAELQSFLDVVYQNKQALELQKAFRLAERLPVSGISSPPETDMQSPLQARNTQNSSTANIQSSTICDLVCPLVLDDSMNSNELMPSEVLAALKLSPDPAKFVLDVLLGSYSQHCEHGGSELDTSVAKSIVTILGQLIHISPKISSMVKEESMKLAVLWKSNLTVETVKETEVWAFLLFLFIYGLVSHFRGEEILRLVMKIALHRNAPMMCHLLGFTHNVPELIRALIQNSQHIEAARFSCAFGLVRIFPIDMILQKCVEHLREDAQKKVVERESNARTAIFQCITDYKLESVYDTEGTFQAISELGMQRNSTSSPSSAPASNNQSSPRVQRQLHIQNLQSNNFVQSQLHNSNFRDALSSRGNHKRPRIDISVDRTFSSYVPDQSTHK
ncbi:hypothetical protein M5689_024007 [Euphorbia peplus]|nr:hypothetical protein M5689_024007 [Euphorbia peplus]